MALIVQLMDDFHDLINKNGDPRTSHWPLMSSPFPTLAICLSYVYLTKVAGPKLMENRKPFELRNVLIAYNLFQVIFSSWLFYECLMGGWWGQYSFQCQPVDKSNSPTAIRDLILASALVVLSQTTEDGEIEVRISVGYQCRVGSLVIIAIVVNQLTIQITQIR
uniref:Elongation of very long chain fatty acids protein n=1 Tax=Timema tahoe TaxID=61484 RepID=A0A7R9FK54_9NEOP|nr:unnamed protein product [Timema tahoe]